MFMLRRALVRNVRAALRAHENAHGTAGKRTCLLVCTRANGQPAGRAGERAAAEWKHADGTGAGGKGPRAPATARAMVDKLGRTCARPIDGTWTTCRCRPGQGSRFCLRVRRHATQRVSAAQSLIRCRWQRQCQHAGYRGPLGTAHWWAMAAARVHIQGAFIVPGCHGTELGPRRYDRIGSLGSSDRSSSVSPKTAMEVSPKPEVQGCAL